ncbi:membrane protein insertase, YidC Oxa1 family [Fructilactobacillus fructivorans]|uniref:membrane protein insertase YidC n=1 Tax=Fructilactobacillus fructivorans TaxID=1614 RepID=UPI000705368E|nr:membrane protein insertase YidC [Fructilactobacillus fructivorans]KRN13405.1 membrane protein insertase, YidC Oxa1 family [Fructilactobacillus fructivorans]
MKKIKKLGLFGFIAMVGIFLTGCVRTDSKGRPFGFVYHYLAIPGQHVMDWLAQYVGGYGWALIAITVIVRTLLLPMMISQTKKSTIQQEKMNLVKPQMTKIQQLLKKATTQEQQVALNQQMMQLYRDNGISMTGGIGCLPLLIQLPVFAALYAAIRYSPEVSHTVFMGIKLGQSSIILAILSFVAYALQGYLSTVGIPKEQKKQMAIMMLISPIMILFVTLSSPAGLGIYFFIGGLFACVQTFIINLSRPRIRKQINEKAKQNPPKVVIPKELEEEIETGSEPDSNTTSNNHKSSAKTEVEEEHENNRKRNAGKQQHHHDE